MKKVNVGLDIGIASVGWAIVNAEEFEIIDAGSRLFNEANDDKSGASASIRREYRGRRRNLRRDKLRREELRKLFITQNWIKNPQDFDLIQPTNKNVYQLRLEALSQPMQPNELMLIFSNFLKHRGVFNLKDEAIEQAKKNNKGEDFTEIQKAHEELKANNDDKLWACEIQLKRLKEKGFIKGSDNKIAHDKYLKELEAILETQMRFNTINQEFREKYLELFNRRRQYFEGPGKNSIFGWNGDQEVFYNRLLGFDSYNREAIRAPKAGLYANLYNILNDLNNLTIRSNNREDIKLTKAEKEQIVHSIFNTKGKPENLTLRRLAKLLDVKAEEITGYRIDKSNKPEFTKFDVVNQIYKILDAKDIRVPWLDLAHSELIDELSLIMTKGQSYDYRKEKIAEYLTKKGIDNAQVLAENLANISLNGSHHLSNQTIKSLLPEMWEKPHSFQQIRASRQMKPQYQFQITQSTKYIPIAIKEIQEMYISPVAKRAFIQALKVLKAIQRFCEGQYEIVGVYIELAREKNSEDQKNFIKLEQKNNENLNKEIKTITAIENPFQALNAKTVRKLRLAIEQEFKCAYCFQELSWHDITQKSWYTEVDHIIPESISFSTSSDNLVLVHAEENHLKGQMTPYAYFNSKNTGLSWGEWERKVKNELYKNYLSKNKNSIKYLQRKINHLLDETDFNDPENVRGFIERNLNDTRTSTTAIKEYLEECKRLQKFDFKLKTINGQFTDFVKKVYFDLPRKNRDYFEHHAIDAIAIAYSDMVKHRKITPHQWSKYKSEIINYDFRFSRMPNHNLNKQFTDETLYSYRKNSNEELVKIQKIDIFTMDPNKIKKLTDLLTKNSNKVLMSHADPLTFQYLQQIWNEYPIDMPYREGDIERRVKNPFIYYRDVLKQPIIKHQNKKGLEDPTLNPPIKFLRYEDNKLGKHLDVTHKYPLTKENKKIVFESFKPIRLDFYRDKYTNQIRMLMLNVTDVEAINDKEIVIKKRNYDSHKERARISSNFELLESVFPGDTIEIEKNNKKYLGIAIGGHEKKNALEIKHIHRNKIKKPHNESSKVDKPQIYMALNSVDNITRKNSNILGIKSSDYMLEFD